MRKRSAVGNGLLVGLLNSIFLIPAIAQLATSQSKSPFINSISPTSGPEGSRVSVSGENFQDVSTVLFGNNAGTFKIVSSEKIIAIVPHRSSTSKVTLVAPAGRASSADSFSVLNDARIPEEVSYKAGYVNPAPPPSDFESALLWGIAIVDPRVAGHPNAEVRIASTHLTCEINGKDVVLNDDAGRVRGGLYRRQPWFGTDQHETMPMIYDAPDHATVLLVGSRADRVWHFWSSSPRATLPPGKLEGCRVKARVKISPGALLQMGMDYWRSSIVPYGSGGNNHEAGASNWYFPSPEWQEATFTDVGGVQF